MPPMSVAAHDSGSGWQSRSKSEFRRQRCKVVLKIHFIGFLAQVCVRVLRIYREFGWPFKTTGPNRLVHHVARDNMEDQVDCESVYVTTKALPSRHVSPVTIDLCSAAERATGTGTIRRAQRICGLWRIYPRKCDARQKLLLKGMELWRVQISLLD